METKKPEPVPDWGGDGIRVSGTFATLGDWVARPTIASAKPSEYAKLFRELLRAVERVELIDRYEGSNLASDKCSQAYRLWYRDKNRTLTESEIKPVHEKIRKSLVDILSAELRS